MSSGVVMVGRAAVSSSIGGGSLRHSGVISPPGDLTGEAVSVPTNYRRAHGYYIFGTEASR